jgi:hypothetical protein
MVQAGELFNWGAVSAFTSVITLVGTVGIGGVMWGKLTERVSNLSGRVNVHRTELDIHEKRMNDADRELARLNQWKEIYAAGQESGRRE